MQTLLKWIGNLNLNKVFLSIGSNKGSRFENIKKCINLIGNKSNIEIINKSKIYETQPMYNLNQKYFLNMVILVKTSLSPEILLKLTQRIEKEIGRVALNQERNQPRKIDIDILTYSDKVIFTKNLIIPHPKINERAFVLKPWTDIDPKFKLCNINTNISELLLNLPITSEIIKYYKEI